MATSPQFASTPNMGASLSAARISTANTNRDGAGTLATIVTGGANGTRIDRVVVTATSTTTAGMVRFYISDATNIRLCYEMPVSAITPSGTVAAFTDEWVRTDGQPLVILPANWLLRASTHNAEAFDVLAVVSGDF